jgi:hypothetical protein
MASKGEEFCTTVSAAQTMAPSQLAVRMREPSGLKAAVEIITRVTGEGEES